VLDLDDGVGGAHATQFLIPVSYKHHTMCVCRCACVCMGIEEECGLVKGA